LAFSLAVVASGTLQAQESGFLPSYEGLIFAAGEYGDKTQQATDALRKMAGITKIMIDQPEIFIAAESPYKGMKPSESMALSESLRSALIANMGETEVVEETGVDVVLLRVAISDIHLKKKKRSFLTYTPAGFLVHTATNAMTTSIMKKLDLTSITIEMETTNAATGDPLGLLVMKLAPPGEKGSDEANWQNMMSRFDALSKQLACRFHNSKVPEDDRESCKILDSYQED